MYIYTYIHRRIHTYLHTYTHIYTYTRIRTRTSTRAGTLKHTFALTHTQTPHRSSQSQSAHSNMGAPPSYASAPGRSKHISTIFSTTKNILSLKICEHDVVHVWMRFVPFFPCKCQVSGSLVTRLLSITRQNLPKLN